MTENDPKLVVAKQSKTVSNSGAGKEDWEGFCEALAEAKHQHPEHHEVPAADFERIIAHWAAEEGWD